MKNFDTIQLAIIIIALFAGYHLVIEIPQLFWLMFRWASEGMNMAGVFTTLIASSIYSLVNLAIVVILLNKSGTLTRYIIEKTDYHGQLRITNSKNDLLSTVFIAMGAFILATRLPRLFMKLFDYFKERKDPLFTEYNYINTSDSLGVLVMELILAIIIIVYSKQFTDYFGKQVTHTENTAEITAPEK